MKKIFQLSALAFAYNAFKIQGAFASCEDCDPLDFDYPVFEEGCDDAVEKGGIAGWVAIACNVNFVDVKDEAEWDAKIAAKEIVGIYDGDFIRGAIPVPDRDEVTVGACGTPKTVAKNYEASIVDSAYNDSKTKYDIYNFMDIKGELYDFGFIDCLGNFYGFFGDSTFKVDENIPETNSEVKDFQIGITFKTGLGINKPTLLPFLVGKKLHL